MKAAAAICLSALLSGLLPAQDEGYTPDLRIEVDDHDVLFRIAGPGRPFLAAVLLSLQPDTTQYFVGLPSILSTFVVLDISEAKEVYKISVPRHALPAGIMLCAQGLVADGEFIWSTPVRDLALDVPADH